MAWLKSIPDSILTLACDYRTGSAWDFSPLARHGTFPAGNVTFSIAGAHFQSTGRIVHPDHIAGRNTTGSIVVLTNGLMPYTPQQNVFNVQDAGGKRLSLFFSPATTLYMYDGVVLASATVVATTQSKCIGVNYISGVNTCSTYINGIPIGAMNGTLSFITDDAAIVVGNSYSGSGLSKFPISCVLETNRPLTASEHAQIFAELSERKSSTRTYSIRGVDSSPDPNTPYLVWAPDLQHPDNQGTIQDLSPTGATGTKVGVTEPSFSIDGIGAGRTFNGANGYTATGTSFTKVNDFTVSCLVKIGSLALQCILGQNNRWGIFIVSSAFIRFTTYGVKDYSFAVPLVVGGTYKFTFVFKSDNSVDCYCNGTFVSNVAHIASAAAGSGAFNAGQNGAAFFFTGKLYRAEIYSKAFSAAEVRAVFEKSQLQSIKESSRFGVPVSTATRGGVAGSYLESTRWAFGTATPRYKIDVSTISGKAVKTIACTTAGHLYRAGDSKFSAQQRAYGVWEFSLYKGAAGNLLEYYLVASTTGLWGAAGQNVYLASIGITGYLGICRRGPGGASDAWVYLSGNGLVSAGNWYNFRVTRTYAGVWALWTKGGTYTTWTYIGGGTDNTYTSSAYSIIDTDALDLVSIGAADGENAMTWSPFV